VGRGKRKTCLEKEKGLMGKFGNRKSNQETRGKGWGRKAQTKKQRRCLTALEKRGGLLGLP